MLARTCRMRRWGRPGWTSCSSASSPASSSSSTWSTGSAFSGSTRHRRWQWMMRTELDCNPIQSSWSVDLASYSTHFFFQKIWIHVMTNMMKNQNIPQWQWTCSSSRCCPRVRWPWWWACCVAGGPLTNENPNLEPVQEVLPLCHLKTFPPLILEKNIENICIMCDINSQTLRRKRGSGEANQKLCIKNFNLPDLVYSLCLSIKSSSLKKYFPLFQILRCHLWVLWGRVIVFALP